MTFGSAEDAQAYVDGVIAPYADCPEETDNRRARASSTRSPSPTSATRPPSRRSGSRSTASPASATRSSQLTRVGQAVLFTLVNNDGEPYERRLSTTHLENTQSVVAEME